MVNKLPQDPIDEPPPEQVMSPEESDALTASFEQAIAQDDQRHYCLRLFVAGATPRSIQALERLKLLCETHLQGRYELEVIDVYQSPSALGADNIVAIPTLVKQLPLPLRRIVGDLSDTEKVLKGLDLIAKE
ncbi:MAG TPA: circadian clock KaiB family protein [Nodosilinea sp.]|nr:circadian clock KaiB family protein [Nodosilinea sp.]